jgi:Tocopherol cyclase
MTTDIKEQNNILRWDGEKHGFYEVYYLKWNDEKSRTAYWIRYTLTSPLPGVADPYCELWGIFFDIDDPSKNFAVKDRFAIDKLSWEQERFKVDISGAELLMNSCCGGINDEENNNSLSWEIEFDSVGDTFKHFPHEKMYTMSFPKTKVLSPHEDCRFSGKVIANGREINFVDAPGQQTHIWGTKHALRWAWGHCNTFKEDESAIWEGLDSQIKLGPFDSPHLTMFYVRHKGVDYLFNSVRQIFANKSEWGLLTWKFEAKSAEMNVKGKIIVAADQIVTVTYTDPDGEKLWCNNSKIATINLELFGTDNKKIADLTSDNGCAFETVDRKTYPESQPQI